MGDIKRLILEQTENDEQNRELFLAMIKNDLEKTVDNINITDKAWLTVYILRQIKTKENFEKYNHMVRLFGDMNQKQFMSYQLGKEYSDEDNA